ncbi:transport ATP binding protein [Candidatus Protochlamydia naegleriophila]|uniref:Transport ATP binding protein n=1 Tax=Candidatus Protochlamydia naegleriophila TaxID=389348 RepID=A0A0U5JEZ1_9BACT|nr:ABC transporter ATP-binding protein [Candidatus Protochlamydia naegleriophila]CUI16326.1 transport ATP binding protein [Candidatus Protochlamydia naegleriophila]
MRLLLRTALLGQRHRLLIGLTILSMILLTFASQLEVVALGVITRKGPDFFELFAPIKEGKLDRQLEVTWEEVEQRWTQLDPAQEGMVTLHDTNQFLSEYKGRDLVEKVVEGLNVIIPIGTSLKALALFIVFVALFKAISLFCQRFAARLVAIRVSRDLRQAYFEHIQALPMEFYQKHNIGSLSSRVVGDASLVAEALNACLVNYLQTPFTVLTTLGLCFYTSWQLSLIIFFGFPLIVFPIVFLAKKVKKISKQIQKNQETFATVLIDFLAGIQTVKVFAMEEFSLKKYREQNAKMAALEQKSARYDLSSRPIVHTIGMFFLATALLYGLYVLQLNVSDVLVYCGLLYVFYEPIKKFAEENTHIQRGIAAAERMQEVLDLQPQIRDHDGALHLNTLDETIEFDDVWFKYESKWVLKGVSFSVRKGQTVALVGPTGSGKSTIVQLLPRLYDVQKGEIRINGRPLTTYTQKSLREQMAFVPQKPFLFLDTVSENISFGRPFSQADIQEAARQAHADEFICQLPNGYQTELSEAGKNLSGGQQQRLAIARALVKKAPILIMDEATSSLDAMSEAHIKSALGQLHGKMTQIVIAHRLSTIEDADKIIFLEHGEKIAEGTKDELLQTCPPFKKMWELMYQQPALQAGNG